MKAEKIIKILDNTSKIIRNWQDEKSVSELEKELVLAKLRDAYEAVYFISDAEQSDILDFKLDSKIEAQPQEPQEPQELQESQEQEPAEQKTLIDHNTVLSLYSDEEQEKPADNIDVQSSVVPQLSEMIGINDKFLIMRDLFDNDSEVFDSVIAKLDEFSSLDSALIYIYDNHSDWNSECDGAKFLMDILTRKLS